MDDVSSETRFFFHKKDIYKKKVIFKSIVWFIKAICISYDVTKVM